jgi:copper resistance protein D
MLDAALICARTAQYAAVAILFGAPLFFLYGLPSQGVAAAAKLAWPRPMLVLASAVLLVGGIVALGAQTAIMTDTPAAAFEPGAWLSVVTGADFGPIMAGRIGLALALLVATSLTRASSSLWVVSTLTGAGALASFAWTGHGASGEGTIGLIQLGADVVHLLAAGAWLGALVVLSILLLASRSRDDPAALEALHRGLKGFSGIGTAITAALLATGVLNSWFLVGPNHVRGLLSTTYGLLLGAKVLLFLGMLSLAGLNCFTLTPHLARSLSAGASSSDLRGLRLSVALETLGGAAILVLVGVLGTIAPPSGG